MKRPASKSVFIKLYFGDLANGLSSSLPRLVASFVLFLILCLTVFCDAQPYANGGSQSLLGFGDYFTSIFTGAVDRATAQEAPFPTPIEWLCVCALASYTVLDYPLRDLKGMGMHMIIASGGRWRWWLSKCLWVVTCAVAFWLLALAACAFWTVATNGPFDFELRSETVAALQMLRDVASTSDELFYPIFLIPLALSALLLMQLAISLLVRPVLGFVFSMALLYSSAFILNPGLIGNYLMVARIDTVYSAGVSVSAGVIASLVTILVTVVIGGVLFSRFNIINQEADNV